MTRTTRSNPNGQPPRRRKKKGRSHGHPVVMEPGPPPNTVTKGTNAGKPLVLSRSTSRHCSLCGGRHSVLACPLLDTNNITPTLTTYSSITPTPSSSTAAPLPALPVHTCAAPPDDPRDCPNCTQLPSAISGGFLYSTTELCPYHNQPDNLLNCSSDSDISNDSQTTRHV